MATKIKKMEQEQVKEGKPEKSQEVEFVISSEDLNALDTFFMNSLASRRAGVLDADKAFTKTIDMLRSAIKQRNVSET